jgi:transposase
VLSILEQQSQDGLIDLYYGDESGVSEQGYCPYGWQFKDEKVTIPVTHGQQINCFGLLSRQNELHFKTTPQSINTDFLIAFLDEFVLKITKNTVIVLDNAKIHQAKAFKQRCEIWKEKGLFIVYLPPYSPHLNIIEKMWHELKQRWLKTEDYQSFDKIVAAVNLALSAVGSELFINFNPFNLVSK